MLNRNEVSDMQQQERERAAVVRRIDGTHRWIPTGGKLTSGKQRAYVLPASARDRLPATGCALFFAPAVFNMPREWGKPPMISVTFTPRPRAVRPVRGVSRG